MLTDELSPYVRRSDAADAVHALAKTLRQLGHDVTIAAPRHPEFEEAGLLVARRLTPLALPAGEVTLLDGQTASGVKLVLFDAPLLRDRDPGRLGARAAALGIAAAGLVRQRAELGHAPEVLHLHGAAVALAPLALRTLGLATPTVLTLHELPAETRVGVAELAESGVSLDDEVSEALVRDGRLDVLEAGARFATLLTAVSPTAAAELGMLELGGRVAAAVAARGDAPAGIVNGLDYASWNPATDPALASRFDAENTAKKGVCKSAVVREVGLPLEIDRPLVVFVGALTRQGGADLVAEALPDLLERHLHLLVAGAGAVDDDLARRFAEAAAARPDALAFVRGADEPLRHRAIAGADIALAPARHAPCGLWQLVAQRYGALPVVLAQGGHIDSVVDCDAELETGTGFAFVDATPSALVGAVARALAAVEGPGRERLRRRVMRLDLGWDRPARRYLQLYRQAAPRPA